MEPLVNMLQVVVNSGFGAPAATLAKTPVIKHEKIVPFAHEIAGEFSPTLDALGIAFHVKNDAFGIGNAEVDAIDLTTILHFEMGLFKRKWVAVFEMHRQPLRAEKEIILRKIKEYTEPHVKQANTGEQ